MYHRFFRTSRGFSLLEVMAVLSIISVVAGFAVPALRGFSSSTNLQTGARLMAGWLNVARSEAIARHTIVRFVVVNDWQGKPEANLRKVSLWAWDADLEGFFQITKWQELPAGIILEPTLPAYLRTAAYATDDRSATHGDYVLDGTFAEKATFKAGTTLQPVQARYVEFTAARNARVPGGTERQAIFVVTPGTLNEGGSLNYTTNADGHAANWAQINVDTLTGRVRIYQP